jgi:hypothetical protein
MMNRILTLTLALAAGLLGGAFSHYATPATVFAQAQLTAPKEIRAQRFTLVDEHGTVRGVFAIDNSAQQGGYATIKLFDRGGREVFSTNPARERLVDEQR